MQRAILAELFTPSQQQKHTALIDEHLWAADGARLMDRPPSYRGGTATIFQRAETSPYFGREIGMMYVHAHLRYLEAMAHVGDVEKVAEALGKILPVALRDSVPNARPRQANAYFSSSDAVVDNRIDAENNYQQIVSGERQVEGGWRIYSSGPGIIVNLLIRHVCGLRSCYDSVIIDPVMPPDWDGTELRLQWLGHQFAVRYRVQASEPTTVALNGVTLTPTGNESNPYRQGGLTFDREQVAVLLHDGLNTLEVHC
jgi:cellobiose phosphorylase